MATLTFKNKVSIKAEPDEVFLYFANLKYHYLWNPTLREITPEKELSVGLSYHTKAKLLGGITVSSQNSVVELTPSKKLVLENRLGNVKYAAVFTLTKRRLNTIVACIISIDTKAQILGMTQPVLKQLANRELESNLYYLKLAVEHKMREVIDKAKNRSVSVTL